MASPTVPTANQSESDVLDVRADVWQKRPLLRDIYNRYFAEMCEHLATPIALRGNARLNAPHAVPTCDPQGEMSLSGARSLAIPRKAKSFGTILELGGGSGNFKEYFHSHHAGQGTLIASDVVATPHCDLVVDAMTLPFADNSLDNIVMMDVLHHIPFPLKFFAEAQRALRPGGRIIMTEPYISPASRLVFKLAHPEPVELSVAVFAEPLAPGSAGGSNGVDAGTEAPNPRQSRGLTDPSPLRSKVRGGGAFASNQATPTLIFYRDLAKFQQRFSEFKLIARKRRSLLLYPLSGGFSGPKLLPHSVGKFLWPLETLLAPLSPLLAFRLLVVLEKHSTI